MRKPEDIIQIRVFNYIRLKYPEALFTSTQAGYKLTQGQAMNLKRRGYRNGTPDIIGLEPRKGFHGLLIELKSKDGVVSDDQKFFLARATFLGYMTAVCWNYSDAIDVINHYMEV